MDQEVAYEKVLGAKVLDSEDLGKEIRNQEVFY